MEDIVKEENLVYRRPALLNDNRMHYCPGCSHGVIHKLVAEVIEEMGMTDKAVGVSPGDVPCLPTTILTLTGRKLLTDVLRHWLAP